MPRTKAKPPDDFTEETPPPRQRPRGLPAPALTILPPGEEAVPTYRDWDKHGRIPAGSVLARFAGTCKGLVNGSGYLVAANAGDATPLGAVGATIPEAAIEPWRIVAVIVERLRGRHLYAILVQPEGS